MKLGSKLAHQTIELGNLATGAIGTAANTIDRCSSFKISPSAVGRVYTLPNPTVNTDSLTIKVSNTSAFSFTLNGATVLANTTAIVSSVAGTNGFQVTTSSASAVSDSIQTAGVTGVTNITAWNSVVLIPTLTGNITLNYPTPVGNQGKKITELRTGTPNAFTVTRNPITGTITLANSGSEISITNGALTVEAIDTTNIRQVSNIGSTSVATIPVATLTVSPTTIVTSIGQAQAITATTLPLNATNQNLSWTSSNPAIATVNIAGIVTAISNGSAIITAQTLDGSNKVATVSATITASPQVRLLNNSSINNVALIQQADLQSAYNTQGGFNAPDAVPTDISVQANSLNSGAYKIYLGHNNWWYTNATTGITSASWILFGGNKSNFGASVPVNHIMTYK